MKRSDIPLIESSLILEPGRSLQSYQSQATAISCEEAASVRDVPLSHELKSLILETSQGTIVVHVPGDKRVSLRAVKRALGTKQARLASRACLSQLGLTPGTVCAVLNPVWCLKHLISSDVLELSYVTTNDGTLKGYFVFSPKLLLTAEQKLLGVFSSSTGVTKL